MLLCDIETVTDAARSHIFSSTSPQYQISTWEEEIFSHKSISETTNFSILSTHAHNQAQKNGNKTKSRYGAREEMEGSGGRRVVSKNK